MSTFFNPYWLEPGAAVPVDIATTAALVTEIQRLRQALEQPEREWVGLTDDEMKQTCYEAWSFDPYVIAQAIQEKLRSKNEH